MNLVKYLHANFPGLPLESPLFYNWPVGLRFELGVGEKPGPAYFAEAEQRAAALYSTIFHPEHRSFLLARTRTTRGWQKRDRWRSIFQQARSTRRGIGRTSGRLRLDSEDGSNRLEWAEFKPAKLDTEWLFRKIAFSDFPMGSGFPGEVLLVNLTTATILHMYDDRGMDVLATNSRTLAPIYRDHNPWLLKYDLPRMNALFSQPTPSSSNPATTSATSTPPSAPASPAAPSSPAEPSPARA